ncbi:aromatic acid exporter family protein [Halalkalibacter urbisdiaboli]|uniref:aromatic acid exporter family protein n=1 Tax=Halalkalibacter urbisdiaboli TaxID=1960589 RepID=UPI000B453921|nr:aromatic acid exporter family protein [Halalkalibacter urbisdiaboli]
MNLKIGYRTLKTALGAAISISIANALQLEFYSSAAIITILCISITRRKSLLISWERIAASMIALTMSVILFETLGYNPFTLALLLLLFIPATVKLKVTEGIVTSCVILLHIYILGYVSVSIIINELLLIVIGVGVALLMNLYMPSHEKTLRLFRKDIEEHFKTILHEMGSYLRNGESHWDGKEIPETVELLSKGKDLALTNIHNHIVRYEDQYYHYFEMREKQFEIIERVMPFVSAIHRSVPQGIVIADFLEELSKSVSPTNHVPYFLERLRLMKKDFKEMPLPETREEFELRSSLSYIMHELEQYLIIKDRLWNHVDKRKV